MKNLIIAMMLGLATVTAAHPGSGDHHHHQPEAISESQAEARAEKVVASKVQQGKLTKAWLERPAAKVYKKSFQHGPEWVVEFHDPEPMDEKKKILYVYLTTGGRTLGVNFTGR